jgi:hypothetical protein
MTGRARPKRLLAASHIAFHREGRRSQYDDEEKADQ